MFIDTLNGILVAISALLLQGCATPAPPNPASAEKPMKPPELSAPLVLQAHTGGATGVAFIDRDKVLTCGVDRTVRLWNLENGKEIRHFTGHTSGISSLAVSADGKTFATGAGDGTARLWQIDREEPVKIIRCSTPSGTAC